MEQIRIALYVALIAVVFLLWQAWEKDYPPVTPTQPAAIPTATSVPPSTVQAAATAATAAVPTSHTPNSSTQLVTVETDVLHVAIDPVGGTIVRLALPRYPATPQTPDIPVRLLSDNPDDLYVAQSGLISTQGPDTQEGQATLTPQHLSYQLAPGQNSLDVTLSWQDKNGLQINKIFTFQRGAYTIAVRYEIANHSQEAWSGQFYAQLRHRPQPTGGLFSFHTYQGTSLSSAANPYEKFSFDKLGKDNIDRSVTGGWLAMQQHYFLGAWVPAQDQTNHYYSRAGNSIYTLGMVGPVLNVAPGATATTTATLYGGPEVADYLKPVAPHLELTIDYGWLWPISVGIFWVMKHIHSVLGNWGWAIVLVTVLIKLLFYKLSETSYRSMAKMRKLTPKLQAIKDRYGDDRQKLSQATMELYRKEKANPMSGCLPMIVQIPFFIALYYVLIESVELRQAPFILWIHDLSVRDPYYVLPILMGISMWVQQKLNPAPTDPVQAKMFMFLPVIMTLFFLAFPAGLVLYWLVNNCLSVLQQWYIMKRMDASDKKIVRA